jgi:O-antigen ligase
MIRDIPYEFETAVGGWMQDQKKTTIGFWPTCCIVLTGLLVVMIVDGNAWGASSGMKLAGLLLAILAGVVYFVWRGKVSRAYLVRTGLEWTYGLTLLALFGAWILSADPRQGLFRIVWLLGYIVLFYILADALEVGLDSDGAIAGLLAASGIVLMMAALETSVVYSEWWKAVGTLQIMPPYPYRLISLARHSNAMMGLANLCAPLVLILFLRRRGLAQLFLAFWLVFYVAVLPFTSSWGGWMGAAAWVTALAFFWLWQQRYTKTWQSSSLKKKMLVIVTGLGVLISLGIVLYMLSTASKQPYLHGAGIMTSRGEIWKNALQIWLANPAFGVGPGQFGFGYLRAVDGIPPGLWILHAHSFPVQILAEFGVAGGIALLALIIGNIRWLWKRFDMVDETRQWIAIAVLAGLTAWAVQMMVDDQTGVAVVMVSLILLLACFVNIPDAALKRWPQVSNNFIVLPAMMLAVATGWGLWAYAPLDKGYAALHSVDCMTAAPLFTESMERDPNMSFNATQAGFAWAVCGVQESDEAFLVNAHQAFERSAQIEPDVSLVWANMAVVDWQTGRYHDKAIPNMQHAVALSPDEASFLLNLGWFYEQENQPEQAVSAYVKSLEQQPDWAEHPFWQMSDVRKEALSARGKEPPEGNKEDGYWIQAREAVEVGHFSEAALLLSQAAWSGESDLAIAITRGMLAEAQNDGQAAIAAYEEASEIVQRPVLNSSHQFMLTYTVWLNRRRGITDDLVPGYLQLDRDYGQFDVLEKLYTMYHENGACEEASGAWQTWQRAVYGGAPEALPLEPDCR